jgi:hypothetical protein
MVEDEIFQISYIRIVTTSAFVVPGLRKDLLSVKSLNRQGYADPKESGIFPVINGKVDKSKYIAFMSKQSNLFCLKVRLKPEMLLTQQVGKMLEFEKWCQRLGHVSNSDIQQSIPYMKGLEQLTNKTFE